MTATSFEVEHTTAMTEKQKREKNRNKVLINRHDRVYVLNIDDIQYIEAQGSYSQIYSEKHGPIKVSIPLGTLTKSIGNDQLCRLSRSLIININSIEEIDKITRDGKSVRVIKMAGGKEIELSSKGIYSELINFMESHMIQA
jgi:DNA-binding LytR/AlgR family response regulator